MSIDRMNDALIDVPRGLTNVAVTETAIGQVRGLEGFFQYRDHSAVELATTASFEAVWHLLICGHLPDEPELSAFADRVAARRDDDLVSSVAGALWLAAPGRLDPITGLKAAWPLIGRELGLPALHDSDEEQRLDQAVTLAAMTPGLLGAFAQLRQGLEVTAPSGEGVVNRYLQQVTGEQPRPGVERALSAYLVAAMEHGFNASTFTARVIASTGADMASCMVGALGALTGPLHGGAPARALDTLDELAASGADTDAWLRAEVSAGRRIMGFGHPVYRTVDPRSRMLKQIVLELGGARVSTALEFEMTAERVLADLKPGRALHANVEFYASVLMERCGLPRDMFTATFALARAVGWTAHVLEQARDPKIIRPSARFVGPDLTTVG